MRQRCTNVSLPFWNSGDVPSEVSVSYKWNWSGTRGLSYGEYVGLCHVELFSDKMLSMENASLFGVDSDVIVMCLMLKHFYVYITNYKS